MDTAELVTLVLAAALVLLAGLFSAADAALSSFSHARAEEIAEQGEVTGAASLVRLLADPAPVLNTVLLLRLLCEVAAIVLVTTLVIDWWDGVGWAPVLTSVGAMLVVSYVAVGVGPRTLGRQHAERVALLSAGPLRLLTTVLGPVPRLLILLGNALTPGKGFREGPFASETELRELVDLAEASSVIESGERKMIHSVFELGDTTAREVMVPRTDLVFVERHRNLRQTMSLFLRSGFSRLPVVGENLDEILGFAYLKDVAQRDFEADGVDIVERIEDHMRPAHFVPDSKPVDELLTELQALRRHIAVVVDEYGGTAGIITIEDILEEIVGEITDEYDEDEIAVEHLPTGEVRVSSRFPVDDLDELVGVEVDDEDVDSVGGLMAKHLGLVPIPGSTVEAHGLQLTAEAPTGRRNRVATVRIAVLGADDAGEDPGARAPSTARASRGAPETADVGGDPA